MALQIAWTEPNSGTVCNYHDITLLHLDITATASQIGVKSFVSSGSAGTYPNGVATRNYIVNSLPTGEPVAWAYSQLQSLPDFTGATLV